jgi:hypothetical protein
MRRRRAPCPVLPSLPGYGFSDEPSEGGGMSAASGIHINLLLAGLAGNGPRPAESEEERAALDAIATCNTSGRGYFVEQATRPQTIGYALLDSPVALAAWMLDHDTDSYYKTSRAFLDEQPAGHLTPDRIVGAAALPRISIGQRRAHVRRLQPAITMTAASFSSEKGRPPKVGRSSCAALPANWLRTNDSVSSAI